MSQTRVQKRDILREQTLVREKWQLVHANINLDKALHAFLTETLDNCGITIAQEAFELVQKILNPKGYVRREHKAELDNVGALIRNSDSAWVQQGKIIHTRFDFTDVWWTNNDKWSLDDWNECNQKKLSYKVLKPDTINSFCEYCKFEKPTTSRTTNIKYEDTEENLDKTYSMQKLDCTQADVKRVESVPCDDVRRWETKCYDFFNKDLAKSADITQQYLQEIEPKQKSLEPYWRLALRINKWESRSRKKQNEVQEQTDTNRQSEAAEAADEAMNDHEQDDAEARAEDQGQPEGQPNRTDTNLQASFLSAQELIMSTYARQKEPVSLQILQKIKDEKLEPNEAQKGEGNNVSVANWKSFFKNNKMEYSGKDKQIDFLKRVWKKVRETEDLSSLLHCVDNSQAQHTAKRGNRGGKGGGNRGGNGGGNGGGSGVDKIQDEYGYFEKHRTCRLNEKADLVLKVGYFSEETGLYKQRIVFAEIDGHDKTAKPTNEIQADSIKLALKLMTSTSVQAVLQQETYHIRSNLSQYLCDQVDKSLLSTTHVELPEFREFIKSLQNDSEKNDLHKFEEAIHWVHHLFVAHVKIAFLIYMRELHDIDMLTSDSKDTRMRDHYFFVNFNGQNLPNSLVFQHQISETPKQWLEEHLMLLTRPKIKTCRRVTDKEDGDGFESSWKYAPVVNASSNHANMQHWSAQVRSIPVPEFPYEESAFMPIACATVQRVNISKLCKIVTDAANAAGIAYIDAITLKKRDNKGDGVSRLYADRCFLTRRQQFDRKQWWNIVDPNQPQRQQLRQCCEDDPTQDKLEFNWGYETPERTRSYKKDDERWDQIDVRMHLFDKEMQKKEWKEAADGMWFVQDYADFMQMLQKLTVTTEPNNACTSFAEDQLPNFTDENCLLPMRFEVHDRACHRFSVLSWFFDCRDAGACRYTWEDWVLEYFGAYMEEDEPSDFEKFVHVEKLPEPMWRYFRQRWFEIVLFLEQNFRNAMAPMHYKLFEFKNQRAISTTNLQRVAKNLFNRQTSMLNNRSIFSGLQVGNSHGDPLLSFTRYNAKSNADMTLRERIMSQLHDELPGLDPFLITYLQQFRIPDAELFLRMIRCPNILALRELAIQHRHLLGGQNTASSVQPPYHLQETLKYFPLAVQSEILYMLKFVECDDTVYVHSPAIHETKLMLVPQNLLRQWVRETLEVARRVQTLQTPLQMKCYMFTMQELAAGGVGAFYTFKKLFYTTEAMMNYGSQRSIVFVLLQIRLALFILKYGTVQRSNPLFELFQEELDLQEDIQYETEVWPTGKSITWRPGTCLQNWPKRDLNQFVLPSRDLFIDVAVREATISTGTISTGARVSGTNSTTESKHAVFGAPSPVQFLHLHTQEADGMREYERCLWLLLLYARPRLQRFTAEDFTDVHQRLGISEEGFMFKDDVITAKLQYKIWDNRLICLIDDHEEAPLFFEVYEKDIESNLTYTIDFPDHVQTIISNVPDRKIIYIPKVFAMQLRKQFSPLYAQFFKYDNKVWKMTCVGVRHWAWKRLLVKSVFYDALRKIMTRTSVQLSLYDPELQQQNILFAHEETKSVFGDLEYKVDCINRNYDAKKVQLIFTVHKKKKRQGRVNGKITNFDEEKIPCVTRQMEFVKWCNKHLEIIKKISTCRYMRVDERIVQKFLHEQPATEVNDNAQIMYRSYLYLLDKKTDLLVRYKKQTYIKFPTDYAIIRTDHGFQTGQIETNMVDHEYATCLDTRTYSCAQPELQRKADSQEFMDMIEECTDTLKSNFQRQNWPSTDNASKNTQSWIYQDGTKGMLQKEVLAVIKEELKCLGHVLTIDEQRHMYTLPDYYNTTPQKIKDIQSKCTVSDKDSWTVDISTWKDADEDKQEDIEEDIEEDKDNHMRIDNWIKLRCTTKSIANGAMKLQQGAENITHTVLNPLLSKIRSSLKTPSFLDKQ
jgi:hypothetical protein